MGEEDDDDDDDEEENGDASLADVYNDISDDNSDYVEESDNNEQEDSDIGEEEDEEGMFTSRTLHCNFFFVITYVFPLESPARGTKRKHEDDDNDG